MPETEAIREQDFYEEQAPEEEKLELISFFIGQEWYSLPLSDVFEVFIVPKITFLPGAPEQVIGLINHRGSVLPLVDLKKIFGLAQASLTQKSRILVINHQNISLGLLVDEVGKSASVPISKIEPPMATLNGPAAEFIKGETQVNNKLLAILKIEKLAQSQN